MAEPDPDPSHNLRYVCDMLEQLKKLAAHGGGPFLIYLIDMARSEAIGRLQALGAAGGSGQKRDPPA